MMFTASRYKGKPAVFDKLAKVWYFGYSSMKEAQAKARALNEGK